MKHNKNLAFTIGGVTAVVVTTIMFTLWRPLDSRFWSTYGFLLLALTGVTMNAAFFQTNGPHFASHLTLLTISVVYLLLNVTVSLIFGAMLRTATQGYIILHVVLFAIFLCLWLIARASVFYINKQD